MPLNIFKCKTKVWLYSGVSAWHFVTLPEKLGKTIKKNFGAIKRGWGSLPIRAKIGKTTWSTSIFPDKKSGSYLLPIKANIRKKESIKNGTIVNLEIEIRV